MSPLQGRIPMPNPDVQYRLECIRATIEDWEQGLLSDIEALQRIEIDTRCGIHLANEFANEETP